MVVMIHRHADDLPILPSAQQTGFVTDTEKIFAEAGALSIPQSLAAGVEIGKLTWIMESHIWRIVLFRDRYPMQRFRAVS